MKKFLTFLALVLITVTGVRADNITDVSDAKADGYYTIVCPRSALTVSTDMTTLLSAGKAGTTFNAYDPNFLFQFKKSGDDYVLYNVGAAKYFTNAGNAVDNITDADAITLFAWGDGTAQLRWDDNHALNIGGQMEIGINDWKRADVGNRYTVAEVEPCEVVIKGNVPSTTTVSVKGASYANGATIPLTTSFSISDVVAPSVDGCTPVVTITGTQLVVNYQPNINLTDLYVKSVGAMTTTVNEGQWYVMTQTRDGETPVYDNGVGNKLLTEISDKVADIFTVLRPANEVAKYLIRFINTGAGSYAIQFANGDYWTNEKAPAKGVGIMPAADKFDKFIFNEATNTGDGNKTGLAINATEDGVTYGFNVDHNNNSGGATINYWSDGKQTSGANNIWYIYPVEIGTKSTTTNVTYNYYFRGTEIASKTSEQEIGATVAAPPSIEQTQHIFTDIEYDATAVVEKDAVVRVDVIETTPFVAAESVDKIEHWYALSIRDVNWLYNTGSDAVTGTANYTVSDKYAWAFVGNIFDGYVIYNKEAGTDVALSADEPCKLTAAGTSVLWTIPRVGNYGDSSFGLQTSGQNPINWQSNSLKRWSGFDIGSSFQVVELYLGKQEYTVNITGAPEGTTVNVNGNEYTNGNKVTMDAAESTVTPATIGLYNASVEFVGLNLNVNYVFCGVKALDEIVQGKAYTITSGGTRGSFIYNDGKITSTGKCGVAADSADPNQQFLFVLYKDNYYLYSVGAEKFISVAEKNAVLNDEPVVTDIQLLENEHSSKLTHPVVLQIDDRHVGVSNGYDPAVITNWKSLNDEGNSLQIAPVEASIDMDAILAKFKTGLEVVIGSTGYATFYDEDNRIIPTGVKAYYCTKGEEGVLNTVQITNLSYIPRWTGVILEGTPGTYYLEEIPTIMADDEEIDKIVDDNVLNGTLDDMSVEDLRAELGDYVVYVLAKKNDRLGFYQFVGNTLAGRKAFYVNANALVSGFILDFNGTEGINSVISATNLKAGYDIQGRRINKMQKGINILGGKKIIK